MAKLGWKEGLVPLLILSVAAAVATALAEAGWYQAMRPGIGLRVLLANLDVPVSYASAFDLAIQIRPARWVLATGLAVTFAVEIWRRIGSVRAPRPARPARA